MLRVALHYCLNRLGDERWKTRGRWESLQNVQSKDIWEQSHHFRCSCYLDAVISWVRHADISIQANAHIFRRFELTGLFATVSKLQANVHSKCWWILETVDRRWVRFHEGAAGHNLRRSCVCQETLPEWVLAVQKVLSGSGRAGRLCLIRKHIGHRLVARPELDNTFWTDSTGRANREFKLFTLFCERQQNYLRSLNCSSKHRNELGY